MPNDANDRPYKSIWLELFDTPHTLGYLTAAGIRTRYLEAGDRSRPTVMLLHGTAGSIENFTNNIRPLSQHFHVLAIDMWGCGWTDKPTRHLSFTDYAEHALAVLDEFDVEQASFIGVSLGSAVAVQLANDHPDRAGRIIMCAPAGIILDPEKYRQAIADIRARRAGAADEPTWDSVRTILSRLVLDDDSLIDDLIAVRLAIYRGPGMREAMPFLVVTEETGIGLSHDEWRALPNPLLVIAAVDAPNAFLANARKIAELAPNAQLVGVTGCDHWPQFERPDAFNPIAIEFLTPGAS